MGGTSGRPEGDARIAVIEEPALPARVDWPSSAFNRSAAYTAINSYVNARPVTKRDYGRRIALLVLEAVGMILSGISIRKSARYTDYGTAIFDALVLSAFAYGFFVSAGFVVNMYQARQRPSKRAHPGCSVGWDIFAWLFQLSIAILQTVVVAFSATEFGYCSDTDTTCEHQSKILLGCEIAGVVLIYMTTVLHLWVFVKACRALDRLRVGRMAIALLEKFERQDEFELAARKPSGNGRTA